MPDNKWLDFFLNAGCSVIPLRKNGKKPLIKWKRFTEEKMDRTLLEGLLEEHDSVNCGVICGEISNNLLVIDLDNAELFEKLNLGELASKTLTVTTSKGYHFYLRFPDSELDALNKFVGEKGVKTLYYPPKKKGATEESKEEIRFQWEYHYVVSPGSIHPSGARYEHFITSPKGIVVAKGVGILEEIERRWTSYRKIKKKGDKVLKEPLFDFIKRYVKPEWVTDEGDRIKMRCPFPSHKDTDPSFNVYKDDQHFYCYGCESGGRHIEFLMLFKGITREQAMRELGVSGVKRKKAEENYKSFLRTEDGKIVEEILRDGEEQFIVYDENTGDWEYKKEIENGGKTIYPVPLVDGQSESIILADGVEEYGSLKLLRKQMLEFALEEFDPVDNKDIFELIIHLFLISWIAPERMRGLAERFIPIISARGPSETGKKRFLTVARWLTYRSMYALKTTKVPTLFRSISGWDGTLILDEADVGDSSEKSDYIEFMNSRADGVPIPRYNSGAKEVEYFHSFGMTILAERTSAADDGFESRKIIFPSEATETPEEFSLIPPREWTEKGRILQRKLLLFRLRHLNGDVPSNLIIEGIKGFRVRESLLLLQTLVDEDDEIGKNIQRIAKKLEERIIIERSGSIEGSILNYIYNMLIDHNSIVSKYRDGFEIQREFSARSPDEAPGQYPITLKTVSKSIGDVISASEVARRWRGLGQNIRSRGRVGGRLYSGIVQITNPKRFIKEIGKYIVDVDYDEVSSILTERDTTIGEFGGGAFGDDEK